MNSVFTSVVAIPIWLTATTIAKVQTRAEATFASMSALPSPPSEAAPRTTLLRALAASPPITSTTSATTTFGSHSSSWRNTSETAGRPRASKATTSAIRRTNHLSTRPIRPAESVSTPILATKSAKPERSARLLNLTERNSATTPFSIAEAMIQPTMTITRKPKIFGMAEKNSAIAAASEVIIAALQSVIWVCMSGSGLLCGSLSCLDNRKFVGQGLAGL